MEACGRKGKGPEKEWFLSIWCDGFQKKGERLPFQLRGAHANAKSLKDEQLERSRVRCVKFNIGEGRRRPLVRGSSVPEALKNVFSDAVTSLRTALAHVYS